MTHNPYAKYVYRLLYPLVWAYCFVRRPDNYGAAVVLEHDGKILLVRHTYGHRHLWYLPGGSCKRNEEPLATAERELFEEVGVRVPLTFVGGAQATEGYAHVHGSFYKGTLSGQKLRQDPAEIEATYWWPTTALPSALSPITRAGISLYLAKRPTRPGEGS